MPQFILVYPNMVRVFPNIDAVIIEIDSYLFCSFVREIRVSPNMKLTIGTLAAHDLHSDKGHAFQNREWP
jgi:hypothetical protein